MKTIQNQVKDTRERVTIVSAKDLEVSYFCGSGAGGQARNKVASSVQIKHTESGALGRACDTRSQEENKKAAFLRLLKDPKMKFFIAREVYRVKNSESLEETIERECAENNLKTEIKVDGRWIEVPSEYFETPEAMTEHP